eukprot:4319131-Amphidinium_carterae.1
MIARCKAPSPNTRKSAESGFLALSSLEEIQGAALALESLFAGVYKKWRRQDTNKKCFLTTSDVQDGQTWKTVARRVTFNAYDSTMVNNTSISHETLDQWHALLPGYHHPHSSSLRGTIQHSCCAASFIPHGHGFGSTH